MKKLTILLLIVFLSGCTAATQKTDNDMSLMERFHSGKHLIHDDDTASLDAGSATPQTKEAREARQHLMRGYSYLEQDRDELAFEQFSRAAKLDTTLVRARYERGLLLIDKGLYDKALGDFQAVLQQKPEFAPAHIATGRIYFMNGLYPEARKHFLTALARDNSIAEAHIHLGAIYNYEKNYEQAMHSFEAALIASPDSTDIYNNLGLTLSMMGRDAEAVEAFRTALRKGAPSSKGYNNMGLALARLGRYREALEAFRAAGGDGPAWNNLGYFFFLDGQYPRAIHCFEKAMQAEPTYYARAAENLKRARLAAQFERPGNAAPARTDDIFQSVPASYSPVEQRTIPAQPTPAMKQLTRPMPVQKSTFSVTPQTETIRPAIHKETAIETSPAHNTTAEPHQKNTAINQTATPAEEHRKAHPALPAQQQQTPALQETSISNKGASTSAAPKVDNQQTSEHIYSLHLSSFRSQARADAHAARLHGKGLEAFVTPVEIPNKGTWYRVSIGNYSTIEQAHSSMESLTASGMTGLRVVRNAIFSAPDSHPTTTASNQAVIHTQRSVEHSTTEQPDVARAADNATKPPLQKMQQANVAADADSSANTMQQAEKKSMQQTNTPELADIPETKALPLPAQATHSAKNEYRGKIMLTIDMTGEGEPVVYQDSALSVQHTQLAAATLTPQR